MPKNPTLTVLKNPESPGRAQNLRPYDEPWPEWLLRTFVNENVLKEDPFELREMLFNSRDTTWWFKVDNLLYSIEQEAKRVLKEKNAELLELFEDPCLERMSENFFYESFSRERLTPTEASAIAALRGIRVIWQLTGAHWDRSSKYRFLDPCAEHTYDSTTASRIALEMALVIINAIRGEVSRRSCALD